MRRLNEKNAEGILKFSNEKTEDPQKKTLCIYKRQEACTKSINGLSSKGSIEDQSSIMVSFSPTGRASW